MKDPIYYRIVRAIDTGDLRIAAFRDSDFKLIQHTEAVNEMRFDRWVDAKEWTKENDIKVTDRPSVRKRMRPPEEPLSLPPAPEKKK